MGDKKKRIAGYGDTSGTVSGYTNDIAAMWTQAKSDAERETGDNPNISVDKRTLEKNLSIKNAAAVVGAGPVDKGNVLSHPSFANAVKVVDKPSDLKPPVASGGDGRPGINLVQVVKSPGVSEKGVTILSNDKKESPPALKYGKSDPKSKKLA